ncbi:MAG: hypothetical protein MPK62_06285, partial [Alphaproteobacteria bacterium]|nr:hypothetical protein [Alphaproteobacteria bacterium]
MYRFPPFISIPTGGTTATATVSLTPSEARGTDRFIVKALAPPGFKPGAAGQVEFVVNAQAHGDSIDFVFHPAVLTIEQGSSAVVSVINLEGAGRADAASGETTIGVKPSAPAMAPTGVNLHWNTITPHTTLTAGTNGVTGGTDRFAVPWPADGASVPVLITVGDSVAAQRHVLTTGVAGEGQATFVDGASPTPTELNSPAGGLQIVVTPKAQVTVPETESIAETDGDLTITLTLDKGLQRDSVINIAIEDDSDNLTQNADFRDQTTPESVAVPAGTTSVEFTIGLRDDNFLEGDEVFVVKYSAPDGAPYAFAGSEDTTTVTVTDDDDTEAQLRLALVSEDNDIREITRPEFGQSLRIKALLHAEGNEAQPIITGQVVTVTPGEFTGAWGNTAAPAAFRIPARRSEGFSEAFIMANSQPGDVVVPAPTFAPDLGDFTSPADASGSGTITLPRPTPVMSVPDTVNALEGRFVEISVGLDIPALRDVTGTYRIKAGTADPETDFTIPDEDDREFTIAAGESATRLLIPTVADRVEEESETFTVTVRLTDGEEDATLAEDDSATVVTIADVVAEELPTWNFWSHGAGSQNTNAPRVTPWVYPQSHSGTVDPRHFLQIRVSEPAPPGGLTFTLSPTTAPYEADLRAAPETWNTMDGQVAGFPASVTIVEGETFVTAPPFRFKTSAAGGGPRWFRVNASLPEGLGYVTRLAPPFGFLVRRGTAPVRFSSAGLNVPPRGRGAGVTRPPAVGPGRRAVVRGRPGRQKPVTGERQGTRGRRAAEPGGGPAGQTP